MRKTFEELQEDETFQRKFHRNNFISNTNLSPTVSEFHHKKNSNMTLL